MLTSEVALLDPKLAIPLGELEVGEFTDPIAARGGLHVVQLVDLREAQIAPFEVCYKLFQASQSFIKTVAIDVACALGRKPIPSAWDRPRLNRFRSDALRPGQVERGRVAEARALIDSDTVHGGMIPKLEESFRALKTGVGKVRICAVGHPHVISHALEDVFDFGTTLVA